MLPVVVTDTFVVLEPRVSFTVKPLPLTEATLPKAAAPGSARLYPLAPRPAAPLGRTLAEGREPVGPRLPFPAVQLPDVAVIVTVVAVNAVTGDGRADGLADGVADGAVLDAATAVTQAPDLSALADVALVWLKVVEPVKLTVTCAPAPATLPPGAAFSTT